MAKTTICEIREKITQLEYLATSLREGSEVEWYTVAQYLCEYADLLLGIEVYM